MSYRWFRYVRHHDRDRAESEGWRFSADLGGHHGVYSVLMEMDMSNAPQATSGLPTACERFEEAVAAFDRAQQSGIGVDIAFARRELAVVSWNLKHAIVEGLRAKEESYTNQVLTTRGKVV